MRSLKIFNERKEKSRKEYLKKHGIEPCNKPRCRLCKPHKVWKKYSKFFNKQRLMEKQKESDISEGIKDHKERTSEDLEVTLESGTKYKILNYTGNDKKIKK